MIWLPYALIAPQIIIKPIFSIWPASQTRYQCVLRQDAFGPKTEFIGMADFAWLFADSDFLNSFVTTISFSAMVAGLSMRIALIMADRVIRRAALPAKSATLGLTVAAENLHLFDPETGRRLH